ncbi:hypothetical protein BJX99DRAFT_261039 [Aspergillus californicus]
MADAQSPGYLETDNGSRVIIATSFILVLATVLLALRLFARSLTQARRGWDEFLLVPSYLCLVGLIICLYLDVIYGGLGRPTPVVMDEDPQQVVTFLKLLYILDWFYVPSNAMSRVSVVALYLRIFTDKIYRGACWLIIAAQLECFPLAHAWDRTIPGGACFNQVLWYKLSNIPNVIADVFTLALPIPTVWNLKASRGKKVGITMVFLMGSIPPIAPTDANPANEKVADEAFSWTAVECGMYFSAACLIGLRPLFVKLPHWVKNLSSDRGSSIPDRKARPFGTGLALKGYRPFNAGLFGLHPIHDATPLEPLDRTSSTVISPDWDPADQAHGSNLDLDTERQIKVRTRIEVRRDSSSLQQSI